MLHAIIEGTATVSGKEFFRSLVQHLAEGLGVRWVFVAECLPKLHARICTANANLAAALPRSKRIPARTVVVIPPVGQRLEMHRIVEYFDNDQWFKFDPSSLHKDIPMKPWRNIIMAKTTRADEDIAMKPRMGTSLGCPYGQELELLDDGITLWGNDFFWTIGKPLAEFEASDEVIDLG